VRVTTASHANSIPVAEYTLATILFSLKHGWRLHRETIAQRRFVDRNDVPGSYRTAVGLISMGMVGRIVLELLKPFDLEVLVYDPYLSHAQADLLGVEKTSLEAMFKRCHVVSIHAPELDETRGMVTGALIASLPIGATLINTARGSLINEAELIGVLEQRPDLQAVLDVTEPEPPSEDSKLFVLPNVMLTPHIAGSAGGECRRMGAYMVEELDRYLKDEPLKWEVTPEMRLHSSHRTVTAAASPKMAAPA
jgi:phosphoglycerate dehydrogenase-like enzyme